MSNELVPELGYRALPGIRVHGEGLVDGLAQTPVQSGTLLGERLQLL